MEHMLISFRFMTGCSLKNVDKITNVLIERLTPVADQVGQWTLFSEIHLVHIPG